MSREPNFDESTTIIIDLVKSAVQLLREIQPNWQKAYLRFFSDESRSQVRGSYVYDGGIDFFDPVQNKEFFRTVMDGGKKLLAAMGKDEGLFLLIVDSDLHYEIKFEYQDMNRWQINKLDGRTGIPEGIE